MQSTPRGERAIAAYKTLKGMLEFVLAGMLVLLVLTGGMPWLQDWLTNLSHHVSRAWSIAAARSAVASVTPRRVMATALALFFDGLLTLLEGWALRRGRWWGRWVVVVATGSLLPFELVAFARSGRWFDLAAFAVNLAIVAYLARTIVARS